MSGTTMRSKFYPAQQTRRDVTIYVTWSNKQLFFKLVLLSWFTALEVKAVYSR